MAAREGGAAGVSGLFVRRGGSALNACVLDGCWQRADCVKCGEARWLRTHGPTGRAAPTAVGGQEAGDVVWEEGSSRGGGGGGCCGGRDRGRPWGSGRRGERLRGGRAACGPVGPCRGWAGGGRRAHSPKEGASAGLAAWEPRRAARVRRASSRAYRRGRVSYPHGNGNRRDSGGTTDQPAQAGEGEPRPPPSNHRSGASLPRGVQPPNLLLSFPGLEPCAHPDGRSQSYPHPVTSPAEWVGRKRRRSLPVFSVVFVLGPGRPGNGVLI